MSNKYVGIIVVSAIILVILSSGNAFAKGWDGVEHSKRTGSSANSAIWVSESSGSPSGNSWDRFYWDNQWELQPNIDVSSTYYGIDIKTTAVPSWEYAWGSSTSISWENGYKTDVVQHSVGQNFGAYGTFTTSVIHYYPPNMNTNTYSSGYPHISNSLGYAVNMP
ncbi:MAG: hypothetical protein WBZ29_16910 [Methanocella sp.]